MPAAIRPYSIAVAPSWSLDLNMPRARAGLTIGSVTAKRIFSATRAAVCKPIMVFPFPVMNFTFILYTLITNLSSSQNDMSNKPLFDIVIATFYGTDTYRRFGGEEGRGCFNTGVGECAAR